MKKNNNDDYVKKMYKAVVCGTLIVALGIFIGYQSGFGNITSIQGYLYNASDEATDGNATDANATDANATDGNASSTDNILFLNSFNLNSKEAYAGDNVSFVLDTSGACLKSGSITFTSDTNYASFTVPIRDINSNNQYVVIPTNVSYLDYRIKSIFLVGINSDSSTFSSTFYDDSLTGMPAFYGTLSIKNKQDVSKTEAIKLNSISLAKTSVEVNEKAYINYQASSVLTNLKLTYKSTNNDLMSVSVKSLTDKPYFEIPTNAKIGTYELVSATLTSSTVSTIYTKTNSSGATQFNFNVKMEIKNTETKTGEYIYNSEDLNEKIYSTLYSSDSNAEITINANSNPVLDSKLFSSIKGTNRKLIINYNDNIIEFNGKDINNPKSIDASLSVLPLSSNEKISALVEDGIVLNFMDNGSLPGKALIRLKSTTDLDSKLTGTNKYLYYFNTNTQKFVLIDTKITKSTDGYYEFNLNHNSDYLLVNKKLDKSLVATDNGSIVDFQKSKNENLLIIGIGLIIVIIVIVIMLIVRKNKNEKESHLDK